MPAHNKLESVGPTFSSLESKTDEKKYQDNESQKKSFSDQRKRIYLVNNIFAAWENANIQAG